MAIHIGKGEDPLRTVLSTALAEVSGIKPQSLKESIRVIAAIPEAIAARVWKVYKGSLPPASRFSTVDLYQAPQPSTFMNRISDDGEEEETAHDKAIKSMEVRFGKEEVAAEAELSRKILESARKEKRIFPAATPDGGPHG
jgi:hypothetical protein